VSNYIKGTNFTVKDGLAQGDPGKIVKGTEIDIELNAVAAAISTKADSNSPVFTGTPSAPTASLSTSNTQIATTAFVQNSTNALNLGTIATQDANNVNITGGNITGITDLAVADGGTGRSSLTLDNIILGDGSNPVKFVAPGADGNILTSNGVTWVSQARPNLSLGVDQTWQNVTSSRSKGTTYTNTTGRPIMANISMSAASVTTITTFTVAGVQVARISGDDDFNPAQTISAIVPAGATYVLSGGSNTVNYWAELR
jgi:hypothetical protein